MILSGIPILLFVFSLQARPVKVTPLEKADRGLAGLRDVRHRHFLEVSRSVFYSSSSRTKRSAIFSTGVKVCPQETAKAVITSHRAYYRLRVCQEAIWEAFRIFFDRVPNSEEYMTWVHTCQHENLCMDDLAQNFSSSTEHLDMIARRVAELGDSEEALAETPEPGKDCPWTENNVIPTEPAVIIEEANMISEKQHYMVEFSVTLEDPIYSEILRDPATPEYADVVRELRDKMYHVFAKIPGFKEIHVLGFRAEDVSVRYAALFNGDTELSDEPEGYHMTDVETQRDMNAPKLQNIIFRALKQEHSLPLDLNTLSFDTVYAVEEHVNKMARTAAPPVEESSTAVIGASKHLEDSNVSTESETHAIVPFHPEVLTDIIWIEPEQTPAPPAGNAVTQVEHLPITAEERDGLFTESLTTEPGAVIHSFSGDTTSQLIGTQATVHTSLDLTGQHHEEVDTTVETSTAVEEAQASGESNDRTVPPASPESTRTEEESVSSESTRTEEESVSSESKEGESVSSESTRTEGESVSSESSRTEGESVSSESPRTEEESVSSESPCTEGESVSSESTEGESVSSESTRTEGESVSSESTRTEGESVSSESPEGESVSSESTRTEGESVSSESTKGEGMSSESTLIEEESGSGLYEWTPPPAMRQVSTPLMAAVERSKDLVVFFRLRVSNMMFTENLFNKESPEYKSLENTFLELLLPYLETNLTGFKALEILSFQNGSIIVNSKMKLNKAVPYNVTEAVQCVLEEFCNSASNQLDIQVDSRSLEVEPADEPDPCRSITCLEFSRCMINGWSGEAECVCDPGYSAEEGQSCQSLCTLQPNFCLNGGLCHNLPGHGATCRCPVGKYWHYHGERCDELITLPLDTSLILTGLVGSLCLVGAVIGILIFINKKCIKPQKAVTMVHTLAPYAFDHTLRVNPAFQHEDEFITQVSTLPYPSSSVSLQSQASEQDPFASIENIQLSIEIPRQLYTTRSEKLVSDMVDFQHCKPHSQTWRPQNPGRTYCLLRASENDCLEVTVV